MLAFCFFKIYTDTDCVKTHTKISHTWSYLLCIWDIVTLTALTTTTCLRARGARPRQQNHWCWSFWQLLMQHQDVVAGRDQQEAHSPFRSILPLQCINNSTDESKRSVNDIMYLCMKLFLWRCRSPEAMSHAILWRIRGSGVSESATRQLRR